MESNPSATPLIQLTPRAIARVRSLLSESDDPAFHLRIYIEEGGCSGMRYSMILDERHPDDTCLEQEGITVLIDPFTVENIRGSIVDHTEVEGSDGFKIINPNARQTCGCGKSFTA
jgi:iron-sulfur cluster assembly accessory protein